MKVDIKVPAVGESITEATISEWQKKSGEAVQRDDVLLVLETDKASVEVVAENEGVLEILETEGNTVAVGAVIGRIDTEAQASPSAPAPQKPAVPPPPPKAPPKAPPAAAPAAAAQPDPSLSPAVRRVVSEHQLDPQKIEGTGKDGRITKEDALNAASQKEAPAPQVTQTSAPTGTSAASPKTAASVGGERREPMTQIRRRIAQRLVEAQHTAAILTTFNEVDMSRILELRAAYKDQFKEKYGASLGFMGFFVKATIEALKDFPKVNARIEGTDIVYNDDMNIGIAVGTEKGLLVPVIRKAQDLSLAGVELAIREFANKAREGKISVDDLGGGTFTISNGGVYGSLMSTPILNPPQSGILGMHKIEERPRAMNGQVVIRPMMYLALSYDHRIIDGSESVRFLVKIKEGLEDPTRLLLEI